MKMYSHYLDAFKKFVGKYDLSNDKIKLKYNHSLRVMELAKKYAKLLHFNEEEVEIAVLIGLLHDIGRFEQLCVYDSYNDIKIDHALYGVKLLFEENIITNFTLRKEWYPIIEFAIKNHNKLTIPKMEEDRVLKQARLIRDVDTLDILVATTGTIYNDGSHVSNEIMHFLKKHSLVDRKYAKSRSDFIVISYGYAFGIYYDVILKEYRNNFIKFHASIKENKNFKDAYEEVIKYLDERIENYERNGNKI